MTQITLPPNTRAVGQGTDFIRWLRQNIRVQGHGNVQNYLGH